MADDELRVVERRARENPEDQESQQHLELLRQRAGIVLLWRLTVVAAAPIPAQPVAPRPATPPPRPAPFTRDQWNAICAQQDRVREELRRRPTPRRGQNMTLAYGPYYATSSALPQVIRNVPPVDTLLQLQSLTGLEGGERCTVREDGWVYTLRGQEWVPDPGRPVAAGGGLYSANAIVRAYGEGQAREIASNEGRQIVWLDPARSSCERLYEGGAPGLVFRA